MTYSIGMRKNYS